MNDIINTESKLKRPNFLVVLLVLSGITIITSLYSTTTLLISGPMDDDSVEMYTAEQMENIQVLRDQGADDVAEMILSAMDMTIYQNTEVFYPFYLATLLSLIIGAVGIIFMYQLKKIGFHLYVVYSILPILWLYLFLPGDKIPNFLVFGSLFISLLFIILYAINLKHMKAGESIEKDAEI